MSKRKKGEMYETYRYHCDKCGWNSRVCQSHSGAAAAGEKHVCKP